MKFNPDVKVYGDISFRDKKCAKEDAEQITFFNQLRKHQPDIAELATHIKNEGKKTHNQAIKDSINGLNQGFADVIIIGHPVLYMEIKRKDHTVSHWQPNQEKKVLLAQAKGAFSCVALGYEAALEAVKDWSNAQGR